MTPKIPSTMRLAGACALALAATLLGQPAAQAQSHKGEAVKPDALGSDIPQSFTPATETWDYVRRTADIPMRDGVKLHVVMVIPKGLTHAPILLDRTPYNAERLTGRGASAHFEAVMSPLYARLAKAGYIIAMEDVRGKYGSGGGYIMNRPVIGPLNPTKVDHTTDAYDTIDWLVKNVPESNGRVGTIGTSYDGFTTLMSLIRPHPALKAAVPINPMVDVWKGDDWFHNGTFREEMMDYVYGQTADKSSGKEWWSSGQDDYDIFMRYGTPTAYGRAMGMEQLPFWKRLIEHPSYDAFWQGQAVDKLLAREPLKVPTLYVHSLWDQEDIYGAPAAYAATKPKDVNGDMVYLVMGPWRHGGVNAPGSELGAIKFDADQSAWTWEHVMIPFLDAHLKDGAPKADIAPVTAFETGTNTWRTYDRWPIAAAKPTPLYLEPGAKLGFQAPASGLAFDEYISDPAKPVTYRARPIRPTYAKDSTWGRWLVDDQRFADSRSDVLTYTTEPLTQPVKLAGVPVAHLFASTSGTDSDWVVKLIDVYPDEAPAQPELGGYELPIAMDVLRGRYRDDPAKPSPIPAGQVVSYSLALPNVDHVFLPGHRIMVQIQSSWFPLYDRNPQTYVPSIFDAKPADYQKATQRVFHAPGQASYVELPLVR